ncbi:MAG: hypothetical protein HGA85_05465, partial [Nanoarchaeota archaeon]|nr:hypothetical protein [Nanoarchaeota archaeon]
MRIALVYPAFGVIATENQPNLKAVADNYGIYPNISLAYIAGSLQAAGHELIFLDAMAEGLSFNDMAMRLRDFKPDIMMFTLTTYLFHETIDLIRNFRKKCNAKVVVGGAQVSLYPRETMMQGVIDYGLIGEAEQSVIELCKAIEEHLELSHIAGLAFMAGKKIVVTDPRPKEKNLDKIPFPARNLLPVGRYYSFVSKYRNYTIMITSRGCPYSCTFCEQRTGD